MTIHDNLLGHQKEPLGTKKNHATSQGRKKIMQPLGTKKIMHYFGRKKSRNLWGQKEITQSLGTKKSRNLSGQKK